MCLAMKRRLKLGSGELPTEEALLRLIWSLTTLNKA